MIILQMFLKISMYFTEAFESAHRFGERFYIKFGGNGTRTAFPMFLGKISTLGAMSREEITCSE